MENALILACQNNDKKRIEALLEEAGIDLNARDPLGNTALHYLCAGDNLEPAEKLIARGGKADAENKRRVSPLHIAAAGGNIPLITLLLDKGADINAQDEEDKTPLIYAIAGGREEAAEYLISAGADKHSPTTKGLSPLDFVKAANMGALLPFFNSRFPWIDKKGNSGLHNAVIQNGVTTVKNMLKADKSGIDARNNEGLTPLLLSVSRLNFGISDMLLESGADPNSSRPEDGYTPLHIAAENGILWLGEILLEHGAAVDARARDGLTPLMLAIRGQHRQFADLLIRRGAACELTDSGGKSARDYALEWGSAEALETLFPRKPKKAPVKGRHD